jgi:DNA polymerase elongation subunit (family B)
MATTLLVHIFDAIARDQIILKETEHTLECGYESFEEDAGPRQNKSNQREMVIHLFGCDSNGDSVKVDVTGFRPFFFVEVPSVDSKNPSARERFRSQLIGKIATAPSMKFYRGIGELLKCELVEQQKLIGYTGGKKFWFLKLSVPSMGMFYDLRKAFLDERQQPRMTLAKGQSALKVYESNIDPMLRFFHLRDLQPCGWMKIAAEKTAEEGDTFTAEWTDVSPGTGPVVSAPFLHGFWDIECYSHDKEFPVAQQGYRRVAKQLWALPSVDDIPQLLKDAFAGKGSIKIPPLKAAGLGPKPAEIARIVDSEAFKETLQELWDGRDGILVKQKEERVSNLIKLLDASFKRLAPIAGDPIIQIGTVKIRGLSTNEKHIFVLGTCDAIEGAIVHTYKTEKELLLNWFQWLVDENFDVMVGYNIFGFDERYVWDRLVELGLEKEECVQRMTRLFDEGGEMKLVEKFLSSAALGDNNLYMWNTPGRLRIDLYNHIKRKVQLTSYKLDSVAAAFLSGKLSGIQSVDGGEGKWLLKTKQKGDARLGRYVQILNELGEDLTDKMKIVDVVGDGLVVESEEDVAAIAGEAAKWAVVKDDVSPQELFRLHREGGSSGRARIASYCIQDCDLVYELYKKLEVFNEAMSMANVCSVPVGYIFTRGQGIKIESLIFKDCMLKGQLIEVQPAAVFGAAAPAGDEEAASEESYEGAIVLDPVPGFYTDAPIGVCDFASLYPSTIISENISHDMLVWTKDYDLDGNLVCVKYGSEEAEELAPPGTRWTDIEFDILRPDPAEAHKKHPKKIRMGTRLCRYAQPTGDIKGSLPQIVAKLLAARKAKRAEIGKTDDPFKKALLDAEQNAYKITANSLYGQLGSRTFKIRLQDLAASVTAYARKQIMFSKAAIEEFYGPAAGDPRCSAEVIYGDTDSLFVNFNPRDPATGKRYEGREAVVKTIEITEEAGHFITKSLKAPHDFEYDKTMYPFIIFSKKRYVGNLYEENPDEFKETSMGIVLKRRDNAPLLKMAYGGAINQLLNKRDVPGAVQIVKDIVKQLTDGKMKLSQLTITKSLAADYAGTPPAHKVLADRITARDPGNAPSSGERIGFVYIKAPTGQAASKLQGDRVETPQFIEENKLKPDAEYYIERQLMNPLSQLFGILLEKMPGFKPPLKWSEDPDKLITQRELLASDLLFKEGLQACRQSATRDFIAKLGGTTSTSKAAPKKAATISTVAAAAVIPKDIPMPKKQGLLDRWVKDTALASDEYLMKNMRKAKKSKEDPKDIGPKEAGSKGKKVSIPV